MGLICISFASCNDSSLAKNNPKIPRTNIVEKEVTPVVPLAVPPTNPPESVISNPPAPVIPNLSKSIKSSLASLLASRTLETDLQKMSKYDMIQILLEAGGEPYQEASRTLEQAIEAAKAAPEDQNKKRAADKAQERFSEIKQLISRLQIKIDTLKT